MQLTSKINTTQSEFKKNHEITDSLVTEFKNLIEQIKDGGGKSAQAKQLERGKWLPRQRILALLDPDSEFLEFSELAAYEAYPNENVPAAGLITGIGKIHGKYCLICANDATVKGGTYYPLTIKKHLRAQEIAAQNHLPCLYIVDSGGANLYYQDQVFPDREHFGRIFHNQANLSAKKIPQIAIVMGPCTAGGAYVPAMADQCIMVKKQATIFLAGPPLVQAATGEIVSAEQLGGADLHCRQSGVSDYYAENDEHAIQLAREIVQYLPDIRSSLAANFTHAPHSKLSAILPNFSNPPKYPAHEIYGLIPSDPRQLFPMYELLARILDDSEFHEFKAQYGKTLICGFGHLAGYPVGIIANYGILFPDSAIKGTHFIELCCQRNIPIIFLQNITGFMVGSRVEADGITKHGAKMVMAVACAKVPKITVIVGNSYGAGNYGMCGRAYNPRFLWTWPNSKIAVMGGEQAAMVLNLVQKNTTSPEQAAAQKTKITEQFKTQSSAFYASSRLWDDGIIDPANTRNVLANSLSIVMRPSPESTEFGVFRI